MGKRRVGRRGSWEPARSHRRVSRRGTGLHVRPRKCRCVRAIGLWQMGTSFGTRGGCSHDECDNERHRRTHKSRLRALGMARDLGLGGRADHLCTNKRARHTGRSRYAGSLLEKYAAWLYFSRCLHLEWPITGLYRHLDPQVGQLMQVAWSSAFFDEVCRPSPLHQSLKERRV